MANCERDSGDLFTVVRGGKTMISLIEKSRTSDDYLNWGERIQRMAKLRHDLYRADLGSSIYVKLAVINDSDIDILRTREKNQVTSDYCLNAHNPMAKDPSSLHS